MIVTFEEYLQYLKSLNILFIVKRAYNDNFYFEGNKTGLY